MTPLPDIALISGGSGSLATQIILLLARRDSRIRSCVRSEERGTAWLKKQIELYPELVLLVELAVVEEM